ncbi:MAG: hypothetical protein R6V83_04265 [Candidatus Thorarchaeota archaeon]
MKISMKIVAKVVVIICIIVLAYLNLELINFYANSAEYTFGSFFGQEQVPPDTLRIITFACGGLGIAGTAVS